MSATERAREQFMAEAAAGFDDLVAAIDGGKVPPGARSLTTNITVRRHVIDEIAGEKGDRIAALFEDQVHGDS